jgi:hypothetical protein
MTHVLLRNYAKIICYFCFLMGAQWNIFTELGEKPWENRTLMDMNIASIPLSQLPPIYHDKYASQYDN